MGGSVGAEEAEVDECEENEDQGKVEWGDGVGEVVEDGIDFGADLSAVVFVFRIHAEVFEVELVCGRSRYDGGRYGRHRESSCAYQVVECAECGVSRVSGKDIWRFSGMTREGFQKEEPGRVRLDSVRQFSVKFAQVLVSIALL